MLFMCMIPQIIINIVEGVISSVCFPILDLLEAICIYFNDFFFLLSLWNVWFGRDGLLMPLGGRL